MTGSQPPTLSSLLSLPQEPRTAILQEALSAYPTYIPAHLQPLDKLRYETIPSLLTQQSLLTKDQLLDLLDWKLSHGKFRPTLRALLDSNPEATIQNLTREAFRRQFQGGGGGGGGGGTMIASLKDAAGVLVQLRGVGPATASLVLSCGDLDSVVFFGDEVFAWLMGRDWGGGGGKLKYSLKEWVGLQERFEEVRGVLGLSAVEVEKVGFVFGKRVEGNRGRGKRKMIEDGEEEVDGNTDVTGKSEGKEKEEVKGVKKTKVDLSPPPSPPPPPRGVRRSTRSSSKKTG